MGLSCAKFEIGIYKGREGSISYNIVDHKGIVLIEGIYCISLMYHGFDEELLLDVETGEKYSLDMIKTVLEPLGLFNDFLPILVFDFLIGNTDRHQSNWALILEKYKEVLTEQRKNLIGKYILSKVQLLRKVYGEKEE